ncbi:SapC family protein [Comamonas serinivorans]|nr:SapC family protein [Comamonas serinivorans]
MTSRLQPLSPEQHLGLGLRPAPNWAFCRTLDAVPITLPEFADLVGAHPIVFSAGPAPQPLAVLGAQPGLNDFLDTDLQWPRHQPLPAVLKHHPFAMGVDPTHAQRAVVMLDTADARLVPLEEDDTAQPLFTFDGRPSPTLSAITQQLGAHWAALQDTVALGRALHDAGLLVDLRAEVRLSDGSTHTTRSFRSVNASAFRQLQPALLSAWFQRGWTDAIALHLASLRRWTQLFERRQPAAAPHAGT